METLLALALLAPPPQGGADAFVRSVYAAYDTGGRGVDWNGARTGRYFDSRLAALIHTDVRRAHGEVPTLDGDPFCDCQDFGRVRYGIRTRERGDRAHAFVRFRNSGATIPIRLELTRTPAGWRVADVHSPGTPSLRALLTRAEAAARLDRVKPPL